MIDGMTMLASGELALDISDIYLSYRFRIIDFKGRRGRMSRLARLL